MASKTVLQSRLEFKKKALKEAQDAYMQLLSGGTQSYTIGSRSLTKLDLPKLEETIDKLEKDIDTIEAQLRGGGRRKAVGIVPRDW